MDGATALAAHVPFALYLPGYCKLPADEIPHAAGFDDFRRLPELVATHAC
ncbi:hypothetical protein [Sulfitobacter albidus]